MLVILKPKSQTDIIIDVKIINKVSFLINSYFSITCLLIISILLKTKYTNKKGKKVYIKLNHSRDLSLLSPQAEMRLSLQQQPKSIAQLLN